MSGRGGHTHRGDGALVERVDGGTRDEPVRIPAAPASNGFVAAWARAVRARRAAAPPREPRQLTAASAPPVGDPAAPPAPSAAVPRGAGSPWLRRR